MKRILYTLAFVAILAFANSCMESSAGDFNFDVDFYQEMDYDDPTCGDRYAKIVEVVKQVPYFSAETHMHSGARTDACVEAAQEFNANLQKIDSDVIQSYLKKNENFYIMLYERTSQEILAVFYWTGTGE